MRGSEKNYWQRKAMTRRSALAVGGASLAGLAGAALVGCGDDDDDSGNTPAGGASSAAATPTAQPKRGGKLRWGSTGDINPATMPTYQSSTTSFPLQHAVTDYLTKYDGLSITNVKGHMAEKWEQTSPLDMTVHLRPGVKWHNGDPLVASDVIFNFQKIIGSRSAVESLSKRVTATAVNDSTISLKFEKPLPSVFDLFNYMYLAHPKTFDKLATGESIIGTGPYMFKSWTAGTTTTLVRNPEYWQQGKPYLDELEYHVLPAANLATSMEAGEIDYTLGLVSADAQRLSKNSQFKLQPGSPGFAVQNTNTNVDNPVLSDKRVRQAINFAIDRKRIAEEVFAGFVQPITLVFPEYSFAYDKQLAQSVTRDLNKAKSLLNEAGYNASSAPEVPIEYTAGSATTEGISTILQNDLKQIGFKTKLVPLDSATASSAAAKFTYQGIFSALLGYAGMYPTTYLLATGRLQPPSYLHYDPPGFRDFLTKTFDEGNVEATKVQAMKSFNQFMLDEAIMCPATQYVFLHMMRSNMFGFNYNVVDDVRWEEVWLA
jgi:peptide/nickel transport system substrate-binding protein